jgi:NAD(P)H-hydrate epimerase
MNGASVSIPDDLPHLPARAPDAHKGTFGRALIVGGSRGMSGAAALAGLAALRGGAGLVQVAVPASSQAIVAAIEPSYLTVGLAEDSEGRICAANKGPLESLMKAASAVAIGPGLGRSDELDRQVLAWFEQLPCPAVFDADALNALAAGKQWPAAGGPRILTPHPGEFSRLTGQPSQSIARQREAHAQQFAAQHGVVLVLKGHRSVITDGSALAVNSTGNPGMATGGTGDVLTGLIGALLAQGMTAYDAARLGVFLHGLAGDLAAAELGQVSLIASDLVRFLPAAFRLVQGC